MAANTTTRVRVTKRFTSLNIPLAASVTVKRGNYVGAVPGSHTCAEVNNAAGMTGLGTVTADVSTAGDPVPIELDQPIQVVYCDADSVQAGSPALATDFLKPIYWKDDHTFSLVRADGSGGYRVRAGVLIDVSSRDGVGVWVQPLLANNGIAALIS